MSVESNFFSKLIETGDYDLVDNSNISAKFFSGSFKTAFRFVQDFKTKYSKVPSAGVFVKKFPQIELEEELPEPLDFYIDEVRNKAKHNTLADAIEKSGMSLSNLDTPEAIKVIYSAINTIENDYTVSEVVDYCENATDRFKDYELRKNCGGIIGMSTNIPQLDFVLGGIKDTDLTCVVAPTNVGKAHPLSTPILTPNGFIPMKRVKVGTEVIGEDGKPYKVSAIHPQGVLDVYELTFSDGTTSRCSKEHLWKFKALNSDWSRKEWRVETLGQLMKRSLKSGKGWNLAIPVNKPVEFSYTGVLPIHPYALGVLLGDGGFTGEQITLTNPEEDILTSMSEILNGWGRFIPHKGQPNQYAFTRNKGMTENMLNKSLRTLGLFGCHSQDKFIPRSYLHASVMHRKMLLQGLMDTDGHISAKEGNRQFFTTSERLRDDFIYLCRSLGYRCTFAVDSREGNRDCYIVQIATRDLIFNSVKHLYRDSKVKAPKKEHHYEYLKITGIQFVGREECQCISVDSKDHTYLCDDFIVTHNTWMLCILAAKFTQQGYKVGFGTREMSGKQLAVRMDAINANISYSDFRTGTLSPQDEKKYLEFLKKCEKSKDRNLIIEAISGGVTSIGTFCDRHKPDVLLLDGGYLFTDDAEDSDWKGIMETFRLFKSGICMRKKVPMITNSQMPTGGKASLSSISFSKALANECDNVLALEQPEDLKNARLVRVKPLKLRDSGNFCSYICNWDFKSMNYEPTHTESTDGTFEKPEKGVVKKMSLQ